MSELVSALLGGTLTLAFLLGDWTAFLILGFVLTVYLLAHAPSSMWNNEKSTGTWNTGADK